jgi:hypothetical protein
VTTIRAHPPVETPAGLVVALPPEFSGEGVGSKIGETDSNRPTAGRNAGTDPTVPDVFDLAVPCHRDHDRWLLTCLACNGTQCVLHGRYRVLEMLPIVADIFRAEDLDDVGYLYDGGALLIFRGDLIVAKDIYLPGAVPGGVALIVERVEP